jgi:hypothetical protein
MKPHRLVPNFHIHVSVSDTCVPTIGPPIFWEYLFQIFCISVNISRLRSQNDTKVITTASRLYKHLLYAGDVVSRTILFNKIELFFLYVHTHYEEVGILQRVLHDFKRTRGLILKESMDAKRYLFNPKEYPCLPEN